MTDSWQTYFMEIAWIVSSRSKDPRTKVGCVISGPDREIRSTGYNGPPRGVADLPERLEKPAKYLWISHAEENAVAQAARIGVSLKDATAFVTHHPCARCARSLIQAGVRCVVVGDGVWSAPDDEISTAKTMLKEAGVDVRT